MFLFGFGSVLACCAICILREEIKVVLSLIVLAVSVSLMAVGMGYFMVGFIVVLVYVGAVTVLILFVIMMVSVNYVGYRRGRPSNIALAGLSLLAFLIAVSISIWAQPRIDLTGEAYHSAMFAVLPSISELNSQECAYDFSDILLGVEDTQKFNYGLYTTFWSVCITGAGFILFASMISSIYTTFQDYTNDRTQDIYLQTTRSRHDKLSYADL